MIDKFGQRETKFLRLAHFFGLRRSLQTDFYCVRLKCPAFATTIANWQRHSCDSTKFELPNTRMLGPLSRPNDCVRYIFLSIVTPDESHAALLQPYRFGCFLHFDSALPSP